MKTRIITSSFLLACGLLYTQPMSARRVTFNMSDYGIKPNTQQDLGAALQSALKTIKTSVKDNDKVVLNFEKGTYNFHVGAAQECTYYISNHDQDQPKRVMFNLTDWHNLSINGNGADFIFHGRLIPFAIVNCTNTTLKDFSIDFSQPQIGQVEILKNNSEGITFKVAPWMTYRLDADKGTLTNLGEGWENELSSGIAFEGETRHVVYNTGDIGYDLHGAKEISPRVIQAPNWKDSRMIPGTVIAMRSWYRPAPGIFANESKNTTFKNVKVHYAEGMGLIAYRCTNITLDGFGVCLRDNDDPRYFTTQADATHFSQCKGKIISRNGLYEHMMDDAINVHGIYLKVDKRVNSRTLETSYGHGQAWGFKWGDAGDEVSFVLADSMQELAHKNHIRSIKPIDTPTDLGVHRFLIEFEEDLDPQIGPGYGIEDLAWCPTIDFSHNIVRNNRARGALFSSPLKTVCKDNLFDHTSGTAILLCGDCNGWYESGACRDLLITNNRFINALTSQYQFTNAVISIYPEIPHLSDKPFHGGKKNAIRIINNEFETFDLPLLYAKSVDGLLMKNNTLKTNNDYAPFHWNKKRIFTEKVTRANLEEPKDITTQP